MKKIIVLFTLVLTAGLSAFANRNTDPGQQVLNEFKKEFAAAQNVSWDRQDDFDKATFVLAGKRVVAYFNSDGQLEGCIREIFFDQLPLAVMTAVDKKFSTGEILAVREITNSEGTTYRITLVAKNKKYSLKLSASGNFNEVERITK